jgi:Adenylate cyclase associated (CAP) C terminal
VFSLQIFLTQATAEVVEITTAKISAINITVLPDDKDNDPMDHPVPEQFVTTLAGGVLVIKPVSHG